MLKVIANEPLLHFVILGAGFFWLHSTITPEHVSDETRTIIVDRQSLLTYLKYRPRPSASNVEQLLENLSRADLQRIVDEYTRDEILYREAKRLQLDKGDYVARTRLIRQLEFAFRGFGEDVAVTEQDIEHHYETHLEEYYAPPSITFTHVFFSAKKHGTNLAKTLAKQELSVLNTKRLWSTEAAHRGDRFLYHSNYIDAGADRVSGEFGEEMQKQVFDLEPNEDKWQGPFQSTYGYHLVLLRRKEAGHPIPLGDVASRIEQSIRASRLDARLDQYVRALTSSYRVRVDVYPRGS